MQSDHFCTRVRVQPLRLQKPKCEEKVGLLTTKTVKQRERARDRMRTWIRFDCSSKIAARPKAADATIDSSTRRAMSQPSRSRFMAGLNASRMQSARRRNAPLLLTFTEDEACNSAARETRGSCDYRGEHRGEHLQILEAQK
jgi:hypothetical protein